MMRTGFEDVNKAKEQFLELYLALDDNQQRHVLQGFDVGTPELDSKAMCHDAPLHSLVPATV